MTGHELRTVRFQLLGPPAWQIDGRNGELTKKYAALVAYVAVSKQVLRDSAASRIWGGGSIVHSRDNLHHHIGPLRETTGHAVFRLAGDNIRFAPGVECDIDGDLASWTVSDLLSRSRFLDIKDFVTTADFKAWLQSQRAHWRQRICDELVRRRAPLESADDLARALQLGLETTQEDPLREAGWRLLMWRHFVAGDRAASRAAHNKLLAHCGSAASTETEALRDAIERGLAAPRAGDVRRVPAHPPVFVGRDAQWAAMDTARELRRPVLLFGPGGIGKSRLLGEFMHRCSPPAITVGGSDGNAPYATLARLLRALFDFSKPTLKEAEQQALAAVMPELRHARVGGRVAQEDIRQAVEQVLQHAISAGLRSVAIDNLDRADTRSLALWRRVADGAAREKVFFAFTARPMSYGPMRALIETWGGDSEPLQTIAMPPLSADEVAELVATLAFTGVAADVGADALHSHAGGNPLFLLETLREVVRSGSSPLAALLPRPGIAMAVLDRAVADVSAGARPVVQLAAVGDVDFAAVATALGMPQVELDATLAELRALGLAGDGGLANDLVREAVLAGLTADERRHWHGVAAALDEVDATVPRARVAGHWAVAQRWPEAGAAFRAAGDDALRSGNLVESRRLLLQAMACLRKASDSAGEFDVLYETLPIELQLFDALRAQPLVARLHALAATDAQRARAAIAAARVAIETYRHDDAALMLTTLAVQLAAPFDHLTGAAWSLHAVALAQAGQHAASTEAQQRARHWTERHADASDAGRLERDIAMRFVYVHFEAGRYGHAIAAASDSVGAYEAAGDLASADAMSGNLAALLLMSGDAAAAVPHAERAHRRHRAIEPSATSALAVANRCMLASSWAHAGRYEAALEILVEDGRSIADARIPAGVRAKTLLCQAEIWLTLGDDARAHAVLLVDDSDWLPALQVQRSWAIARALQMRGEPCQQHLERMDRIHRRCWDAVLTQASWLQWACQGDAREAAAEMERVEALYRQAGMPGAARSAALQRLRRLCELDDDESIRTADALACEVRGRIRDSLHPSTSIPDAWMVIATALMRAGAAGAAAECLGEARRWIVDVAMPNVPLPWRDSFVRRNPVNRALLS